MKLKYSMFYKIAGRLAASSSLPARRIALMLLGDDLKQYDDDYRKYKYRRKKRWKDFFEE